MKAVGAFPKSPDTVTKAGSWLGLNCTELICSFSVGLSGITLIVPVTISEFGFI